MHVRVRIFNKTDTIVVVESKLTKIEKFREKIKEKLGVEPNLQRLFYGGKLLENGYTFHDYNIKLNDVILLVVQVQHNDSAEKIPEKRSDKDINNKEIVYKDAKSTLYEIGDLIDARDVNSGVWLEGEIVRIVLNPDVTMSISSLYNNGLEQNKGKENDVGNTPVGSSGVSPKKGSKGIAKFLTKSYNTKKQITKETSKKVPEYKEEDLLFNVLLLSDSGDKMYCKLKDIRPRARTEVEVNDSIIGKTVMINHNIEEPQEKGYWYDFTVNNITKFRKGYNLIGTLYIGQDSIPQNDTTVSVHDKIFIIEEPVPLQKRTDDYKKRMSIVPEKRSQPLRCLMCRDDFDKPCKVCGCYLCSGKEDPGNILLCDECDNGFHMKCLSPPLTQVPDEDWFCPSCKRDPNLVVAPGAAKQRKKTPSSKGNRDWGRGMACMGKTKTCAMPTHHFGPIPGIEVGMCWRFRIQVSESGVHRPPVSGIHGRDVDGAYSLVLSGGYEDDVDNGEEFTYTGSGGRDLSGNKRTAEQSCDQTLTRENRALARNCAVKLNEEGADAGDNWRQGKPVRVVRSYKMLKHFPKYAPKDGLRYDGIYKVVKYYPEKGLSGYRVWKYLLRRDDPSPAPWKKGAKQYPITYPDGYLQAEAEKKALKEKNRKSTSDSKKRPLSDSDDLKENLQTNKKLKIANDNIGSASKIEAQSPTSNGLSKSKSQKKSPRVKSAKQERVKHIDTILSSEELDVIRADTVNAKLWDECLTMTVQIDEGHSKQEFINHVTQVFLCIICQDVVVNPVTTPCLHNFCMSCIKLAFKTTESQKCPYCRNNLQDEDLQLNENLRAALRTILPGYDAGKK